MLSVEMLNVYSMTSTELLYTIWTNFRLQCVKFSINEVVDYFVSSINLTPTCVINSEFRKALSLKLYKFDYRVLEPLDYVISFLKLLPFRSFRFKIYAKKH